MASKVKLGRLLFAGERINVYECTLDDSDELYAAKVSIKSKFRYSKNPQEPILEAKHLRLIKSNRVIRFHSFFEDNLTFALVTELCRNSDFKNYLAKPEKEESRTIQILARLLLGIADLHKAGVIHRDIKPENVLLDPFLDVKLCDFGSSLLFDVNATLTEVRAPFVGSPDFMPPEVVNDNLVSPSSDLWSYGCCIYEAFEGVPPFHGVSNMATFDNISSHRMRPPERMSPQAIDLFEKLTQHSFSDRIGSGEWSTDYTSIRRHDFFSGIDWNSL